MGLTHQQTPVPAAAGKPSAYLLLFSELVSINPRIRVKKKQS